MPRLVDSFARTDLVIAALNDVLASDGIPGLTMRRIAAAAHLSPAALTDHYGNRARLLRVIAHWTGLARCEQLTWRTATEGALAFLPNDDDDVVTARAWLAWCELGRSDDGLVETLQAARAEEYHLLARALHHQVAGRELDTVRALIDGLLVAVCAPTRPMPRETAREILAAHLPGHPPRRC